MFGEILKELRKREGLTQEQLAKILGVSKSTVGMYEQSQRRPHSDELLMRIAGYFGVTIDYLKGYSPDGVSYDFDKLGIRKVVVKRLPMLGKIACGKPVMCEQEYETLIDVSDEINADFCVTAQGDSMINVGIFDGDYVFVRQTNTASNGDTVVALLEDSATIKTFYKFKDHIELKPENDTMSPIIVNGNIQILGKVFGVFRLCK